MKHEYYSLIPSAEPFLFPGEKAGILLVHGFTGAPKEMRTMGEFFAAHGYMVMGIRLPGHATDVQDLPRVRWQDWLHAVEDGFHLLQSAGLPVFIMGLSMGGVLTLTAAARLPIAGAVAMSTPYYLSKDPRLPYARLFALIMPKFPKGASDWRDQAMLQGHVEYPYYPSRAIAEVRDLIAEMQRSLAKVNCPVLLIQSKSDGSVAPENVELIFPRLGAAEKSILWLEKSGHVVIRDLERQVVFDAALEFVRKHQP